MTYFRARAQRIANTREQRQTLNKKFLKQPELIKQFNDLRSAENCGGQSGELVSARENFQLEIAQSSVPWRVIVPPVVNRRPIEPSLGKSLLQGTLVALTAGVGAGLLRDRFDHVFHQPGDVKDSVGLPLLGHIPHVEFFKGVREDNRFLLQELDQSVKARTLQTAQNAATPRQKRYQRFFYQEAFRIVHIAAFPQQRQPPENYCPDKLASSRRQIVGKCFRQNTFRDGTTGVACRCRFAKATNSYTSRFEQPGRAFQLINGSRPKLARCNTTSPRL